MTATIPPEQAQDYANLIESVQHLVTDAKKKSPLFSVVSLSEAEKNRCGALLHMVG